MNEISSGDARDGGAHGAGGGSGESRADTGGGRTGGIGGYIERAPLLAAYSHRFSK